MLIASWNVNSVKARLQNLLTWLEESKPDIVALQELKCVDEAFPRSEIEALGYNIETFGQARCTNTLERTVKRSEITQFFTTIHD